MIKKRILSLLLVAAMSLMAFPQSAHAADYSVTVAHDYKIAEDRTTTVRTIVDIENTSSAATPESLTIPVPGKEVADIEASFEDDVATTAEYSTQQQAIIVDTGVDKSGESRKWSITLNYSANILRELGKTAIFQVAPQQYEDLTVGSETVSISAHLELGLAKPRGMEPTSTTTAAEQQIFTWANESGPLTGAVGLMYGELGVADVTFNTEVSNDGWWWKTQVVTLPPDTNQQQVFLESISPQPSSIRLDTDGNVLAEYKLRPKQSVQVEASVKIAVNNYSYSLTETATKSEIPQDIIDTYTKTTDVWQAQELDIEIEEDKPAIDTIRAIYVKLAENIDQAEFTFENSKQNANNLVGALRGNGFPARLVLGKAFTDGAKVFDEAQAHAWVEAYAPSVGWITLDPTIETRGDYFGTAGVQHVGMVLRGIEDDFPPDALDGATVEYVDQEVPEIPEMKPELSVTNYVLLPGVAITQIKTTMPAGVIVDGAAVQKDDNTTYRLGSLAPLQTVTSRNVTFGAPAFASTNYTYGIQGEDAEADFTVLQKTAATISYVPMLVLLGALLLVAVLLFVKRRRSKKQSSQDSENNTNDDLVESDSSLDDLVMTFSDERSAQEGEARAQRPDNTPPYVDLNGRPRPSVQTSTSEAKPKSVTIQNPQTEKAVSTPNKTATPPRRRKPPRLIQ